MKNTSNKLAKECIVTALILLMKTQEFSSISITDITKKAGVSRMAYYRNYTSKEDILNKYMEEIGESVHNFITDRRSHTEIRQYYQALFERLGQHSDIGLAAYRANLGDLILSNINKFVFLTFPPKEGDRTAEYRLYFLAGAFYNVLIEWLKGGKTESTARMAEICCEMTCEIYGITEHTDAEGQMPGRITAGAADMVLTCTEE